MSGEGMTNERGNLEKKLFLVCAKGTIMIYDNIKDNGVAICKSYEPNGKSQYLPSQL